MVRSTATAALRRQSTVPPTMVVCGNRRQRRLADGDSRTTAKQVVVAWLLGGLRLSQIHDDDGALQAVLGLGAASVQAAGH
ncbi:hypothetical protein E2562_038944 [Oryza meyeriana var. granulata]|uniref:Uncharacterized protein n=1 Tax=Oryza meyeriana var. granulata TaxID=110450 RepID=A0A6G1DAY7_9ORYZ|nr:hypothetical protein E2562_038944 [Oryza meyeriana var. granulata]